MAYDIATADAICDRLVSGESLRTICKDEAMPSRTQVLQWLDQNEEFRAKYAQARALQAECLVDEMQDIADDGSNDWMEAYDREGNVVGWKLNGEAVQRSKIRLEQRRWYAEKLLPKKYGAKVTLAGDSEAPLIHEIRRTVVDPASK